MAGILPKVTPTIGAGRGALGEGIGVIGRKGVLCVVRVVAVEARGHQLARGRRGAAVGMEARIRHHARRVAVGRMLWYVAPTRTRVVRRHGGAAARGRIAGVVVRVLQAVLVRRLGPARPPRPVMFALQRGAAAAPAPVASRRVGDGDGVA
jgi:hypothetical protein